MRASCLVQRQKTPDRRSNLSRPYIKLKVYGQTVLLYGGHGRNGGHGRIAPPPLDPPVTGTVSRKFAIQHSGLTLQAHNATKGTNYYR